jgi:hypothetical protein
MSLPLLNFSRRKAFSLIRNQQQQQQRSLSSALTSGSSSDVILASLAPTPNLAHSVNPTATATDIANGTDTDTDTSVATSHTRTFTSAVYNTICRTPTCTYHHRFYHRSLVYNEPSNGVDDIDASAKLSSSIKASIQKDGKTTFLHNTYSSNSENSNNSRHMSSSNSSGGGDSGDSNSKDTNNSSSNNKSNSDSDRINKNSSNKQTKKILRSNKEILKDALQKPAGKLYIDDNFFIDSDDKKIPIINDDEHGHAHHHAHEDEDANTTLIKPGHSDFFIPEVCLHDNDGRNRNRVLV